MARITNTRGTRTRTPDAQLPAQADAVQPDLDTTPDASQPDAPVAADADATPVTPDVTESDDANTDSDAPADAPTPDTDPAQADAPTPDADDPADAAQPVDAPATDASLLATATSATASLEDRESAFVAYATSQIRALLQQVRDLPDDQPVYADVTPLRASGESGRGPSAARAMMTVAHALLGAGAYDGQCHDNTKNRKVDVFVVAPRLFATPLQAIFTALDAPAGFLRTTEKIAWKAGVDGMKAGTLHGTAYNNTNKRSRIALEAETTRVAARITSAVIGDLSSEYLPEIRRVVAAVSAEANNLQPYKGFTPPTDLFAVKLVTAGDPAVASA